MAYVAISMTIGDDFGRGTETTGGTRTVREINTLRSPPPGVNEYVGRERKQERERERDASTTATKQNAIGSLLFPILSTSSRFFPSPIDRSIKLASLFRFRGGRSLLLLTIVERFIESCITLDLKSGEML